MERLALPLRERAPRSGKPIGVAESLRERLLKLFESLELFEAARIHSEKLAETNARESHPARRIEQQNSRRHGIENAPQFRIHLPPFFLRAPHHGTFFKAQEQRVRSRQQRAQCDPHGMAGHERRIYGGSLVRFR